MWATGDADAGRCEGRDLDHDALDDAVEQGVVYGEDISYGLYEVTGTPEECWVNVGDRYLLADNLAADVFGRARLDEAMCTPPARCDRSDDLARIQLAAPAGGAEGGNGEWDDLRDFRAADFVTDDEGTGFVHCAPSHGMEEYELYRDLGMLEQVITYNVIGRWSFPRGSAVLWRQVDP